MFDGSESNSTLFLPAHLPKIDGVGRSVFLRPTE
ncbi:MAG: hypothetical protein ACI814_002030 [Mariniblastus sp.]